MNRWELPETCFAWMHIQNVETASRSFPEIWMTSHVLVQGLPKGLLTCDD